MRRITVTRFRLLTFVTLITSLAAVTAGMSANARSEAADTIYLGGDIVTMNPSQPSAEALAVKDGRVLAVGTDAGMKKHYKHAVTRIVDLQGKTLLPGFLDAHSHYVQALTLPNQVNVYAPPAGPGKDVDSIVALLREFRDSRDIPPGELIQAYGYDDTVMPNGRLLNRDDLDKALPDNPVIVSHVSMHGAVFNSAALRRFNLSAATPTPEGGVIVREPGTNEPYGLIMETAYLPVFAQLPKPEAAALNALSTATQRIYAANGYTTVHDGATHASELAIMQDAAASGANIIDIIAYPFITELDAILQRNPAATWGIYNQRLKIGGVKITIDGSPQGRTAYFSTPYLTGGPGGQQDWRGELTFPQGAINQMVKRVYDLGVPLNLHANGDAAIDSFLSAHETAAGAATGQDRNITLIHSQFVRPDQLDKFVQYKVQPSLYTLHTFYFAAAHIANRGAEQAAYMSPMRDAIDRELYPTNHTDYVVAPLDPMFMLWSAVNRVSRSGQVVGPAQRVTPWEGLAAMTINVARQYDELASKGSLEAGKLADMVVLDRNPLKIDPQEIKDIKVLATLKEGVVIYPQGESRY